MIKIPNITPREILEVMRKKKLGVPNTISQREYNITYNDIKKIMNLFSNCHFENEVEKTIETINEQNRIGKIRDRKAEYRKYRPYYMEYNRIRRSNAAPVEVQ